MRSLFPEKIHYHIYICALIVLVIGMPISKFLMSLSQLVLVGNWLLEGNLREKFSKFFRNKSALAASSLILLHLIGLLYTSNFNYAANDIRIKAPLLVLPLVMSTSSPLPRTIINIILQFFVAAVIFGTIVSTLVLTGVIHREIIDTRAISIFISHIRFALLICIAVFICGYFIYHGNNGLKKVFWTAILLWLIVFLILLESVTGLGVLLITLFILTMYIVLKSRNKIIIGAGVTLILVGFAAIFFYLNQFMTEFSKKEKIDFSKLETHTAQGNLYEHDPASQLTENGHYIWIYYCTKELERSWNLRSKINFYEKDMKGNELRFTLMRYLASKGLRKDSLAMSSLTDEEIKAIENGVTNVNYSKLSSLTGRLHEIGWELELYKNGGDPNGHSLIQRFEYWKAALHIIKDNGLVGVGTGDVQDAFNNYYSATNSPLQQQWRLRSHNQYLTMGVAFGIAGMIWFIITLIYPMIKLNRIFDYLYITFFIVAFISFFTEDTLETQAGVTFYAFFNSFFLFARSNQNKV